MEYKYNCPSCGKEKIMTKKSQYLKYVNNNSLCIKCHIIKISYDKTQKKLDFIKNIQNDKNQYDNIKKLYIRKCSVCNTTIYYKQLNAFLNAQKINTICRKCAHKLTPLKEKKFERSCPVCGKKILYVNKLCFNNAVNNNVACSNCVNMLVHNIRKNSQYKKKCNLCDNEIKYSNKQQLKIAVKNKSVCLKCAAILRHNNIKKYKRNCPICDKEILYSNEKCFNKAINNNVACCSCTNKKKFKNPMTRQKLSIACKGKNNNMYGKSVYSVWLRKYGKSIADKKYKELKIKLSLKTKGKNNPMYGKPAPIGAGNGWKGYYKNIYFRSLLEFNYLYYLIDNNIDFENGEKSKYKIQYETDKGIFNYHPDFYLIDTNELIEIKPKKLINTYINQCKFKAAKEKLNDKYIILTEDNIELLNINKLYTLYINKDIIFDIKSEEKFLKYYEKNKGELK